MTMSAVSSEISALEMKRELESVKVQIDKKQAELSRNLEALDQQILNYKAEAEKLEGLLSQGASEEQLPELQKTMAGKEKEKEKLLTQKKRAEGKIAATNTLTQNAEKDHVKIPQDAQKVFARLELSHSKAKAAKEEAEKQVASENEKHREIIAASEAEAAAATEKRVAAQTVFDQEYAGFKAASSSRKQSLQEEDTELQATYDRLEKLFGTTTEEADESEKELKELEREAQSKKAELPKTEADLAKKLQRTTDDTAFLKKELERVKEESERKRDQLDKLGLGKILDNMRVELAKQQEKIKENEKEVGNVQREVDEMLKKMSHVEKEHAAVKTEFDGARETRETNLQNYEKESNLSEKNIERMSALREKLEDQSWQVNQKYHESIEKELARTQKQNTKKKALGEEEKKLKETRKLIEAEAKMSAQLESRIQSLEKDLKAEKQKKKKAENLAKQSSNTKKQQRMEDRFADNHRRDSTMEVAVDYFTRNQKEILAAFIAVILLSFACMDHK